MVKRIVIGIVLLSSCAHRHGASTTPTPAPDLRACNEPAYSIPGVLAQDDMGPSGAVVAAVGLAVVAVADPGAFRCKPGGISQDIVIKRPDGTSAAGYVAERP